ncbi:MAG TPA: O-methyltransferase [Candidatus Limnocylindria bacterium]|nr:O-methyltransferase [Candidatus Limnocylindria bacterium]
MSETSTLVTAEHFEYIARLTTSEDDFLRRLKDAADAAGIPPIWIAPEQASFVQILLRLGRATEVIEIGTLAGYSAIVMARALPAGGRVRTIEISPQYADFAERWVAKSDVAGKVQVLRGAGMDVLPGFESQSADAAFLDADKQSYPLYLRECLRIVRTGGLILVDNAFAFGELFSDQPQDPETNAVRTFNEQMSKVEALQSVIVPLGDGLWVGVKR